MSLQKHFGKGRKPKSGEMNGLERAYSDHLFRLKLANEITDYWFEPFSMQLAKGCWYRPDFLVMGADNELSIHETKGNWEDDALVKIKVASEKFPFKFLAVKKAKGGGWDIREVGSENLTAKAVP